MYKVDLNSDLGESFGAYTIGLDEQVIQYVSSANVACGYHAGDPLVMDKTVAAAKAAGVAVGAHPGYPDLMGFGRRNMVCSPKEVKAYIQYQMGALKAFTAAHGVKLQHCKPHGALYNMAGKDMDLAMAIAEGIYSVDKDVILLGLAGSRHCSTSVLRAARSRGGHGWSTSARSPLRGSPTTVCLTTDIYLRPASALWTQGASSSFVENSTRTPVRS